MRPEAISQVTNPIPPLRSSSSLKPPNKPNLETQIMFSEPSSFFLWTLAGAGAAIVFASFFEWTLHRFVMHRPLGPLRFAFQAHALLHHHVFKADHTYHLVEEKDKWTIPMAWWNGPVLVLICSTPFTVPALFGAPPGIALGGVLAIALYYGTYEYLHWCMHLPKNRRVEKPWFFRRLNGHHLLHHRYMHKNYNVVLPLADLCLGTLLLRSKIPFPQARGAAVPDVQPLPATAS